MYVSMKGMLAKANQDYYAVMAINCFNLETARAVIQAAEELHAPIIINIVQEHLLAHCDSELIAPVIRKLAERSSVEVALNLDHGEEIGVIKRCLHDGFSSVMVDASSYTFAENCRLSREIVEFAAIYGGSVEGELGSIGVSAGEQYTNAEMCTNPSQAQKFIEQTGIDTLAISYGSSHGNYPAGYVPEFNFDILQEIKQATNFPLVLHGGSGSGESNIKKSVQYGINKINVGCDFMNANVESIQRQLAENPTKNYWEMIHQVEEESQEIVKQYIRWSGSAGKSK